MPHSSNYSYKYNTEISVFSVFICRYSVFFGIYNTDVGIGIGILKYRGIDIGIGIPTQLYLIPKRRTLSGLPFQTDDNYLHYTMFTQTVCLRGMLYPRRGERPDNMSSFDQGGDCGEPRNVLFSPIGLGKGPDQWYMPSGNHGRIGRATRGNALFH
jgi:hypothetical protein